jgi:transcriptional regulator with PAS, ATPase and Fis domain
MQKNGEFREDLFYRLNVIPINIPPIRERKEDLEVLIPFIMRKISEKWKVKKYLPQKTFKYLISHQWPGNIREIENVLERAFVLSQGDNLLLEDFKIDANEIDKANGESIFSKVNGRYLTLQELELKYVKEIMKVTTTKEEAAKVLGIGRKTLYRKEELLI